MVGEWSGVRGMRVGEDWEVSELRGQRRSAATRRSREEEPLRPSKAEPIELHNSASAADWTPTTHRERS